MITVIALARDSIGLALIAAGFDILARAVRTGTAICGATFSADSCGRLLKCLVKFMDFSVATANPTMDTDKNHKPWNNMRTPKTNPVTESTPSIIAFRSFVRLLK